MKRLYYGLYKSDRFLDFFKKKRKHIKYIPHFCPVIILHYLYFPKKDEKQQTFLSNKKHEQSCSVNLEKLWDYGRISP